MLHANISQMKSNPEFANSVAFLGKDSSKLGKRAPLRLTWSAVELDGSGLTADALDIAVSQVIEGMRIAQANDRDEFLICDIAAGIPVGSPEVAELHGKVEALVAEAAARVGQDAPEMRLSLRGQSYDLRCYLGRNKPTDYLFDGDC